MTAAEKLLRELIALPSVNPAFLPPNDPRAGERRVAEFLLASAASAGFDVETREVAPGRSNVLARLTPSGPVRQRVIFAPHMDTVGEPAMPDALFVPGLQGDRLYGRGACDTKGSVAAMFTALAALARNGGRPSTTELMLVALVDEESVQAGSRALVAGGFRADLAVVGEPTRLRVVTAHKGAVWLTISTRGRAAHGSRPELGRNAIHAMAKVVDALEGEYAATLRQRTHPVLRPPTVNVGAIRGGRQANIVPAHCEIDIDRRTIPGETRSSVHREVKQLLRARGVTASVADTLPTRACPALACDERLPLVRTLLAVAAQARGDGVDYFSDAAVLAAGGIPSVVFGPGDIAQAHTADEWISLRSLERATAMLTRFLRGLP